MGDFNFCMRVCKERSQQHGAAADKAIKRFLISVEVLRSEVPIRLVVKEDEPVSLVIKTVLKNYSRQGRLPVLGSDHNDFYLYCPNSDGNPGALSPSETIGSRGELNFILCKKRQSMKKATADKAVINRFLISVEVMGRAGPIRFFVKEDELVSSVIDTVLKNYARHGRLPVLGADHNEFFLYCPNSDGYPGTMSSSETIGSWGARNFMLFKKTRSMKEAEARSKAAISRKGSGSWKYWILPGAHS